MYGIGSNMWTGFKVKVGTYSVPGACGFGYVLRINFKFMSFKSILPKWPFGRSFNGDFHGFDWIIFMWYSSTPLLVIKQVVNQIP